MVGPGSGVSMGVKKQIGHALRACQACLGILLIAIHLPRNCSVLIDAVMIRPKQERSHLIDFSASGADFAEWSQYYNSASIIDCLG